MRFTIICNILLSLFCYKLFGNWELPIRLCFDPFRIVGGFPTLIDSFFDNYLEKTAENTKNSFPLEELQYPVLSSQLERTLSWTCPILESSNQCFTVVTSSECLGTSQLSYIFWINHGESEECFHGEKGNVECIIPHQSGNICQNVVVGIRRSGNNSIFFDIEDVSIDTQIAQEYREQVEVSKLEISQNSTDSLNLESNFCKNYTIYETIFVGGENDTNIFPIFPFGVNSTSLLKSNECSPPFLLDIFVCNCRNSPVCQVPILYLTPNATYCGFTTISIYHTHGFIYSVVVTSSTESSAEPQKHTVLFFNVPQTNPLSKFDLKRGRFHCPSETSCIAEILYPFSFLNSLELPYQIGILVFSALIGIVIISKVNEE
ncbi:hypothetical protein L3Y34_001237 [Caenorhabditis briggsae]|uniref:Uncharacterized protein n=1 Tax=Caenorhabditis briggsae TaxID=6238 RepID=A0AAE9DC23_CAEBR|nr:hypothetical protein L3Y34_001237 [Caenorhabditis briggsae]